jgi:hypothetical protein
LQRQPDRKRHRRKNGNKRSRLDTDGTGNHQDQNGFQAGIAQGSKKWPQAGIHFFRAQKHIKTAGQTFNDPQADYDKEYCAHDFGAVYPAQIYKAVEVRFFFQERFGSVDDEKFPAFSRKRRKVVKKVDWKCEFCT